IGHGEEIFTAATCVACHQSGGEGGIVGPDLAGIAERLDVAAMLTEIIEPSKVINENYKPWYIELKDFTDVTGLVTEENDDHIVVVQNPLENSEGIKIARKDISRMTTSELSTMPVGLLNYFTR